MIIFVGVACWFLALPINLFTKFVTRGSFDLVLYRLQSIIALILAILLVTLAKDPVVVGKSLVSPSPQGHLHRHFL